MLPEADRTVLRDLARQVAEAAALPVQDRRRRLWREHNALRTRRPLIFIHPEGSWCELVPQEHLTCADPRAREMEEHLRRVLYAHEHFDHDAPVEAEWKVHKAVSHTGWGLEPQRVPSSEARGAWRFQPVIEGPGDLKKLRHPDLVVDEETSARRLELAGELFGDILEIRYGGVWRLTYHLMSQYTDLRGLEEVMVDMYAEPQMLHDAMAFLTEGHKRMQRQYQELGLLEVNNESTYNSSGGFGYCDELPREDYDGEHVRPCDMWGFAEAQEMAQVGPDQHREFVLEYEKQLLAPFGLNGYGCCEDLTGKLDDVLTIPRIRRISISPWADVDLCAERLGGGHIFSWKPHPAHLVGEFDEDRIRAYVHHTVEVALDHGCVLEMVLKDTHTCEHHPERFDRWAKIAREEVDRACAAML